MLTSKKLKELKKELDDCSNPVFLYDNDCDGLCSYLLFYKYKKAGTGVRSSKQSTDEQITLKVKETSPDKVFILDIPVNKVTQEFVEEVKVPVVHVEHHIVDKLLKGVKTFNPTLIKKSDNAPTSAICYNVVKQNLWLATIGIISDWHITKETKKFAKENPKLLNPKFKDPAKAMFESKIGNLGRMFNFLLKGKSSDISRCIANLREIKDADELLERKTKEAIEIWKRFDYVNNEYQSLYNRAVKSASKDKLLLFQYEEADLSFSSELSNELLYRYPKKVTLIARKKENGMEAEFRCSLRSGAGEIRSKMIKALKGLDGNGGGHPMACGARINAKDFDVFLERLKKLIA